MGRGASKSGSGGIVSGSGGTIRQFEKEIYQSDSESAMIVTAGGEVITFNEGNENHVFGTEEDIKKMDGGTATHNHPINTIFSITDVTNGIVKGNLQEMRIVTKSGEVHSLKTNGASEEQRRAFNANYANKYMKATNNAHAKQRRGEKVNTDEYVKSFMENWLQNNAKEYGMEYTKGKVK